MIRFNVDMLYSLHILTYLASFDRDTHMGADDIIKACGLNGAYAKKVTQRLVHFNLLNGLRGIHGGYKLVREPEDISIKDVIDVFGGVF